jgi:hypothetical protein
MFEPSILTAFVRYYYLPARNGNFPEIIEVVNGQHEAITLPTLEEDIILEPIYKRSLTDKEMEDYMNNEIWVVFSSWGELQTEHERRSVSPEDMSAIAVFKYLLCRSQDMVA